MASPTDASVSSPFSSPRALPADPQRNLTSQGPLRMSDLGPHSPGPLHSRLHRLEPMQHDQVSKRATQTKRRKTRKKTREGGEEGKLQRGELESRDEGVGEISELASHPNPLLGASTLQQMQARLDPLYTAPTTTTQNAAQHPSTPTISSGSESIPMRDEEREVRRRRRQESGRGMGDGREGEEGEGGEGERPHKRRRRRRRESCRESGPGVGEIAQQEVAAGEAEITDDGEERFAVADGDNVTPPETFQELHVPAPQYYPPPEEIQDKGMENEGGGEGEARERVMEGAPHPLSLTHQPASQPSNVVFVERADGRGFSVRHKVDGSSVVPGDVKYGGMMERDVSSEDFALYSHRFVQRLALIAHGLVAGLSLWDCVVANVLSSLSGRHLTLLQSYHPLSLPAHSLYLLLLSLVSLALLDRLDLAKMDRQCWRFTLLSLPGIALFIGAVLTLIALLVSLSVAALDDRISLYPNQPSLWPDIVTPLNLTSTNSTPPPLTTHTFPQQDDIVYVPTDDPTTARLRLWLGLSVFRSICCVLGWVLLVYVSDHDRMEDYILSMVDSSGQQQAPSGAPNTTTGNHNTTETATTTTGNHNTTKTATTTTGRAAVQVTNQTPNLPS